MLAGEHLLKDIPRHYGTLPSTDEVQARNPMRRLGQVALLALLSVASLSLCFAVVPASSQHLSSSPALLEQGTLLQKYGKGKGKDKNTQQAPANAATGPLYYILHCNMQKIFYCLYHGKCFY